MTKSISIHVVVLWTEIDAMVNAVNNQIVHDVHCEHVKVPPTVEWVPSVGE